MMVRRTGKPSLHDERMRRAPSRGRAPGPAGVPLLGSALDLQRRGQVVFFVENWRAYGDVVRFRLGPFVAHILAHPDHIHHVLVRNASNYPKGPSYAKIRPTLASALATVQGATWLRQRTLAPTPVAHS